MRSGTIVPTITAFLFAGSLTACASGVLVPSYEELEPCPEATHSVEELSSLGEPGCDMTGSQLKLPDGKVLEISGIGAVHTVEDFGPNANSRSTEVLIVNWGVPGVAVTQISKDKPPMRWASTELALELQLQQEKL